jgi:ASC-1-like (ASCH) protein
MDNKIVFPNILKKYSLVLNKETLADKELWFIRIPDDKMLNNWKLKVSYFNIKTFFKFEKITNKFALCKVPIENFLCDERW